MEDTVAGVSENNNLTLRDHLAIDRTTLANERTLLGYVRTSLALAIVGGSALEFFASPALVVTGWGFLVIGVVTFAVGVRRSWRMKQRIDALRL
jgi:putative membrane protein